MEREKVPFDGQRQRDALTELQKRAGLEATAAAQAVNLSYPQYNRYLWGRVPLRTDQIRTFAAAYGVSKADLTRALGLLDDEVTESPYDMAADLRGHIPEDDIPGFVAEYAARPVADQRAAADGIKRMANQARDASRRGRGA